MNYTLVSAEIIGCGQDISLDVRGNKYGVSISKGGVKYRDTENECEYDGGCSPNFDSYDSAFEFFSKCLREFGQGNYEWYERKRFVVDGHIGY